MSTSMIKCIGRSAAFFYFLTNCSSKSMPSYCGWACYRAYSWSFYDVWTQKVKVKYYFIALYQNDSQLSMQMLTLRHFLLDFAISNVIPICLLLEDNQHWKSNFILKSTVHSIQFLSPKNMGFMKKRMLISVYYDNSNKISKTKICRLFTHESHFAWFLCGVLLNHSGNSVEYCNHNGWSEHIRKFAEFIVRAFNLGRSHTYK